MSNGRSGYSGRGPVSADGMFSLLRSSSMSHTGLASLEGRVILVVFFSFPLVECIGAVGACSPVDASEDSILAAADCDTDITVGRVRVALFRTGFSNVFLMFLTFT